MDANKSATESEEAQTRQWENTSEPALTTGAAVHKYTSLLTSDLSHRRLLDVCRAVQASVTELQGAPVRQDESLRSLVARCACSLKLDAAASFWLMISHIRLAFRVARILELDNGKSDEGKLTVAGIWRREFEGVEGAPEKRTFQDWNTTGVKFARLAGGGSIYLLVLVAAQNLRVPLATANAHIAQDFGNLLRWPDDELGPLSPLTPIDSPVPPEFDLPDDVVISSPLRSSPVPPHEEVVIRLQYDEQQEDNQRYLGPRGDRDNNVVWTEQARQHASNSARPATLEGLQSELDGLYSEGKRIRDDLYVRVPLELVRDVLTFRGANNGLVASVCTSMSEAMAADLTEQLVVCFDTDPLNDVDTATQTQHEFQAIHFSWYNRHATKGHDAPSDVPPQMMSKFGRSRTNYRQMIPYPSKDMVVHEPIYQAMECILGDVFSWMDTKVQTILPGVYRHLEATASILPNHQQSLVNPFVGLVINVNVATYAHRDSKDDTVCVVLAVGNFEGGELCLHEAGLVIPLRTAGFNCATYG
ncbi:uncharacterized protein B0H18DRAFT_1130546 [Fomitopsis serialis]|uniref:uncharacterized protein n=1 Tax=Fomitopsis serialis TaxID=139415 RepID=UPI002007EA3D|nr:uncharacterized protein B0H18DRAFT_1130546 [Neoantrodia serialis]KAH9910184.1 hypothetical protein B0H18DRAFT_1130546 [Neoantrodia serialis]